MRQKHYYQKIHKRTLFVFVEYCTLGVIHTGGIEEMRGLVRNCRLCKQPMESSPFMLCATCLAETDRVQSYIRKNPLVTIAEISQSTEVPLEKVNRLVHLGLEQKDVDKKRVT